MSTFLGIGLGPIQTGIFLSGAAKGRFSRLVVADVDKNLNKSLSSDKNITINIACGDKVITETIENIEIYNPLEPDGIRKLISVAAEAEEIATALPGVKFFANIAGWLREGFQRKPEQRRFIYTAENNNHAAELLAEAIDGKFPETYYLNTVVGKMSGVLPADECARRKLAPLTPSSVRGHLVEEFNRILISECPGIETRKVQGLFQKKDLLPFEEAKLYGHNAIHMLLGLHASKAGIAFMHELSGRPDIIEIGRRAFIDESGKALCSKWKGADELFTPAGFKAYTEDLLVRMVNPFLTDAIERVCRDIERKLSWDDRIVGTIRICLENGIVPEKMAFAARLASEKLFGPDSCEIRKGIEKLWPKPWNDEKEKIVKMIIN